MSEIILVIAIASYVITNNFAVQSSYVTEDRKCHFAYRAVRFSFCMF